MADSPPQTDTTASTSGQASPLSLSTVSELEDSRFHSTFPTIPESEHLIATYSCALQREILVQGHLFLSQNHLSFKASIFGWKTMLSVNLAEVVALRKRTVVGIFRNGLEVCTGDARHGFVSLLKRDDTYDEVVKCWKAFHPETVTIGTAPREGIQDSTLASPPSFASITSVEEDDEDDEEGEESKESEESKETDEDEDDTLSANTTLSNTTSGKKRRSSTLVKAAAGMRSKLNGLKVKKSMEQTETAAQRVAGRYRDKGNMGKGDLNVHKPTTCPCDKNGDHYNAVAMDAIFPTSIEKLYGLFFSDHEFLLNFMQNQEKLTQIHLGEWENIAMGDEGLKKRHMDYIKPLTGSVGPKETLCNLMDENVCVDFDDYVSNVTTTTTPNVPSGSQFTVKTRTCFTYVEGGGVRALVTTGVEWTKVNRLLKGVIERSAIDGQKTYHNDLEAAIRSHISAHEAEYVTVSTTGTAQPTKPDATPKPSLNLVEKLGGPFVVTLLVLLLVVSVSHWWTWKEMVRYRGMTAEGWKVEYDELVGVEKELEARFGELRRRTEGFVASATGGGGGSR